MKKKIKNIAGAILCCFVVSCTSTKPKILSYGFEKQLESTGINCIDKYFKLTDQSKEISVKLDTVYDRLEFLIDSSNYEIVVKEYLTGISIVRSIKNKITNIAYWNQYHDNGEIKWKGYTSGYIQRIGKWEYYSENGNLDSIANYAENRVIDYCEAREILEKEEMDKDDLDYSYDYDNNYWSIKNWTVDKKYFIDNEKALKSK